MALLRSPAFDRSRRLGPPCWPAPQSGGMPGISLARQAGGPNPNVSALVFARWISLVYITLAQLRVVFPGGPLQPYKYLCRWVSVNEAAAVVQAACGAAGARGLRHPAQMSPLQRTAQHWSNGKVVHAVLTCPACTCPCPQARWRRTGGRGSVAPRRRTMAATPPHSKPMGWPILLCTPSGASATAANCSCPPPFRDCLFLCSCGPPHPTPAPPHPTLLVLLPAGTRKLKRQPAIAPEAAAALMRSSQWRACFRGRLWCADRERRVMAQSSNLWRPDGPAALRGAGHASLLAAGWPPGGTAGPGLQPALVALVPSLFPVPAGAAAARGLCCG